jgi:biopolymer transport protein TolQ
VIGTTVVMQVGQPVPTTPMEMITGADIVTQVVLAFLALLSAVSWTIIFAKWMEFRTVRSVGAKFLYDFERAHSVDEAARLAAKGKPNPFTRVFMRAKDFLTDTTPAIGPTPERAGRLSAAQVEALLIGLLGTVLGIIQSFLGISASGSGNIGAVAPGVAQALIATALALAVAIPAVFGYNIFASKLNGIDGELEGFGSELIALLVREGRI